MDKNNYSVCGEFLKRSEKLTDGEIRAKNEVCWNVLNSTKAMR